MPIGTSSGLITKYRHSGLVVCGPCSRRVSKGVTAFIQPGKTGIRPQLPRALASVGGDAPFLPAGDPAFTTFSQKRKKLSGGNEAGTARKMKSNAPTINELITVKEYNKNGITREVIASVRDLARKVGGLDNLDECIRALERLQV